MLYCRAVRTTVDLERFRPQTNQTISPLLFLNLICLLDSLNLSFNLLFLSLFSYSYFARVLLRYYYLGFILERSMIIFVT